MKWEKCTFGELKTYEPYVDCEKSAIGACNDINSRDYAYNIKIRGCGVIEHPCRPDDEVYRLIPDVVDAKWVEKAAEEIAVRADEGRPALRCDKCGSLELIRNVPEDGYDCRGCDNFTRTPDEVIGITKIDLEKLATTIIRRHAPQGDVSEVRKALEAITEKYPDASFGIKWYCDFVYEQANKALTAISSLSPAINVEELAGKLAEIRDAHLEGTSDRRLAIECLDILRKGKDDNE